MRTLCLGWALLVLNWCSAQFPFLTSLEIRPGQQRPAIKAVVQDSLGLLWTGSDIGLFRSDGERVDVVIRTDGEGVDVLRTHRGKVFAALGTGLVVRCDQLHCDTVLADTALVYSPVRDIAWTDDGTMVLATYGAGLWHVKDDVVLKWSTADGLPDDHVNDVEVLADGRLVLATDQGLAVCSDKAVLQVFDGSQGAPDNLVLVMDLAPDGSIYAGTDASGVFRWDPSTNNAKLLASDWDQGAVTDLVVAGGHVWVGTRHDGVVLFELNDTGVRYSQPKARSMGPVYDLMMDHDGAVWWCNGSDELVRADPSVLFVPEHEGLDLRGISAVCADKAGRIWFATPDGLFSHANQFSDSERLQRTGLRVDPRTPIVSLAATEDGRIWAATFGGGVYALSPSGKVMQYRQAQGLGNDNVLSARAVRNEVWFATLDGITHWDGYRFQQLAGTTGFTFDALPMDDGAVVIASDGGGVLCWRGERLTELASGPRTFYSLVKDERGGAWALGPASGICRLSDTASVCLGADRSLFQEDLYALGSLRGRLLAFGQGGVLAVDPLTGVWSDLTSRFGLEGMRSQLNVLTMTDDGALWFGCDKGLVRIDPHDQAFTSEIPVLITSVVVNGEDKGTSAKIITSHDRNDVVIRFTALHYTDPGALRFEYRSGAEGKLLRTRDRELAFLDLAPGTHHFQFRAMIGDLPGQGPWYTVTLEVRAPWWKRPWVMALLAIALTAIVIWFVRAREGRIKERQHMEQERVRFQLDALRSQVDPHFLFNSFNTLVDLIETDQQRAVHHVDRLSTFFRNMLLVRDKELITVREELELLRTYFDLQQHRFGKAIDLFVHIPDEIMDRSIVPLTLQLLVENALKHNTATLAQPLHVTIVAEGDELVVSNPHRPRATAVRSTGFGIESITKRYAALSPRTIRVERDERLFCVRIPLLTDHGHPDR